MRYCVIGLLSRGFRCQYRRLSVTVFTGIKIIRKSAVEPRARQTKKAGYPPQPVKKVLLQGFHPCTPPKGHVPWEFLPYASALMGACGNGFAGPLRPYAVVWRRSLQRTPFIDKPRRDVRPSFVKSFQNCSNRSAEPVLPFIFPAFSAAKRSGKHRVVPRFGFYRSARSNR